MRFVDEAVIRVEAGAGGPGCMSFRREKFIPYGGPDGGDGGDGASIYLEGDEGLNTLIELRYSRLIRAPNGGRGGAKQCAGRAGTDVGIRVPLGTRVSEADTGELIGDLVRHGQRCLVARGGQHGRGNTRFKSSTNRAPRKTTPGYPGEARNLRLELNLLADVGLMGLPNAGKSSLIRAISAARPKVADYPFTTLYPQLGVVRLDSERSFVVADVPGLIEGACSGAGLGIRFLKHLSRTRLLLHVVDIGTPGAMQDAAGRVRVVERELEKFSEALYHNERWLVLNKIDLLADDEREACCAEILAGLGWEGPVCRVSALTGAGCPTLVEQVAARLEAIKRSAVAGQDDHERAA